MTKTVAIGGLGAIGSETAKALIRGIEGLRLVAVSARDRQGARARLDQMGSDVPVVGLDALAECADIVVECVPAAHFRSIAWPAVERGRIFVPLSVGQLLVHDDLIARAAETGARILPPTGALIGLDAVRAAAEGTIHQVRMLTRKPPAGLAGAPYLEAKGIDVLTIREATRVFEGTAREGARGFPANVNVAAALSLAGIGPDRTRLEIWADPEVTRNQHTIKVEADSANFEMRIENVPSQENPRTGMITGLSTIAALRGLIAAMRAGS